MREEPRTEDPALNVTHRPTEVERQDRCRSVTLDAVLQARGDRVERVIPRDPLEPALALVPHARERMGQAVGTVQAVDTAVHLSAQRTCGERMVATTAQGDDATAVLIDVDQQRTCVRTVQLARRLDRLRCHPAAPASSAVAPGSALGSSLTSDYSG